MDPKQRRVRGVSTCKKKCKSDDKLTIEFDANHLPAGDNASQFSSWVGVLFKSKLELHKDAKDIDDKIFDSLWIEIKVITIIYLI